MSLERIFRSGRPLALTSSGHISEIAFAIAGFVAKAREMHYLFRGSTFPYGEYQRAVSCVLLNMSTFQLGSVGISCT
jgi:hypothetical protein